MNTGHGPLCEQEQHSDGLRQVATLAGGFNRSMQHTDRCVSSRSVADEAPNAHLLLGCSEGLDVGTVEARLDAAPDRSPVQSRAYVGPGHLCRTGGIRPPPRSRCARTLTLAEREEISRAVAEGQSIRSIAAQLGRAPSTVSRELRRNGGRAGYRASEADLAAWDRACVPSAAN